MKLTNFRLSSQYWAKRPFDPTSKEDLKEYQYFLKHSQWKDGNPFIIDWPFLTVTEMIQQRIVGHYLTQLIAEASKHHEPQSKKLGQANQKSKSSRTPSAV